MVFLTAQWRPRYTGSSGFVRVFDYDLYRRTRACFAYLWHYPRSHFTKLLIQAFTLWCLSLFLYFRSACLASRIHVAGGMNKTILFVAGVLSTSFACALLGLIHQSQSCPMQLSIFWNRIYIELNDFWSNGFV